MRPTLVLVEVEGDGQVARASLEAVTLARGVAEQNGSPLVAATVAGEGASAALGEVAATLGRYGVERLVVLEHTDLGDGYAPGRWGAAVAGGIEHVDAEVVVAPGTDRGTEVLAHAAARLDLPMAANCTEVRTGGSGDGAGEQAATWTLTRLRWGGVLLEDAELTARRALLTVAPHHLTATPAPEPVNASAEALTIEPDDQDPVQAPRVVEHAAAAEGVSLATARVVVSGGRGVGSADGFAPLEELAALLGGAVGCSRVATNAGWRSHNDQVGQTGTRVAPDLYIACGISGATQHWVGCMKSKRILAINTDPEAPMVTRAHDAVIADVHDVLGAVLERVRARTGSGV